MAAGVLSGPIVAHFPGLRVGGQGRPPTDEIQGTPGHKGCPRCLQLFDGLPVCLHVPRGL